MFECLLRVEKNTFQTFEILYELSLFLVVNYKAQSKPMFVIRINRSQIKRLKANIKFV